MAIKGYIAACRSWEDHLGNVTGEMEMRIHYVFHPSVLETLENPPEPAFVEFDFVEVESFENGRVAWVKSTDEDVVDWAEDYLEQHAGDAIEDVANQYRESAEVRAKMRREDLREDRRHG